MITKGQLRIIMIDMQIDTKKLVQMLSLGVAIVRCHHFIKAKATLGRLVISKELIGWDVAVKMEPVRMLAVLMLWNLRVYRRASGAASS